MSEKLSVPKAGSADTGPEIADDLETFESKAPDIDFVTVLDSLLR